jgi:hypothetical protein
VLRHRPLVDPILWGKETPQKGRGQPRNRSARQQVLQHHERELERLGHATIAITLNLYSHLFPRGDDAAELAAAEPVLLG